MRITLPLCLIPLLAACQGEGFIQVVDPDARSETTPTGSTTPTGPTNGGACGEVTHWTVQLTGQVVDGRGDPAAFADVWVEDRGWNPTVITIGDDIADQDGFFDITIDDLVSTENCWGTILDYVVVGQQGAIYGERGVNTPLYNAVQDGTLSADIAPLTLE